MAVKRTSAGLRAITATDLMNPEVLTVRPDMTVRELADFLLDNEISGAPVEDRQGNLVGVVSTVDIAEAASEGSDGDERANPDFFVRGWEDTVTEEEVRELEIEDEELTVADIMTPEVYSVAEDATASEVAMTMLDGHLHRLLVVREGKVVGIISTSDLLGLLVDEG